MSSIKSIRRTNRGIKICPSCKSANGHRSHFCKNINCGEILSKGHYVLEKKSSSNNLIDSSKLITDNSTTIFSVKVRKCGPDYRGFVVFKNLEDDLILSNSMTNSSSGLCYVKNCKIKNYDNVVEKISEVAANCQHIKASLDSKNIADPLYLDHSIIEKLNITNAIKQEILRLSNSMCPLVQRISKHVMVVRTKKTKKHPLGYLHVLFQTDKNRYYCNCDISRPEILEIRNATENDLTNIDETHNGKRKCIHFYSCAWAFASNSELGTEFQYFVDSIFPNNTKIFESDHNDCDENNYMSSIIENDDNIIHLTEDMPVYMELDDSSTFLSKTVKLQDGNTLMMEVNEDSSDCKSTEDKNSTFQLNDVIFLETDKDNQISDVFLTDNNDSLNDIKNDEKPLDIQIMLADSSDVMKFPNLILQEIPISIDSSVLIKKYRNDDEKLSDDFNSIDSVPFKHGTFFIDKDKDDDCNKNIVQNLYTLPNLDDELLFLNLSDDNKLVKSKDCIITSISNDHNRNIKQNYDKSILKRSNGIKNTKKLKSILKIHNEKPNDESTLFLNNNVSNIITIDATISNSTESNRTAILNNIIDSNKALFGQKDTEYSLPSVICNTQETQTNLPFLQWLTGVTEQLNQTMHFQFSGKPKPLTYQIPLSFFECLRDRMCPDIRKKRLPNLISEFHRTNSLPLGKFTKYTWNILKINQVKRIFDTPDMPLEVIRFFCQNSDGTYSNIQNPRVNKAKSTSEVTTDKNHVKIQPGILVTYLKVGKTSTDEKIPTPFCIEWIPNILPKSKVGELTLKFEYGHKSNYHI